MGAWSGSFEAKSSFSTNSCPDQPLEPQYGAAMMKTPAVVGGAGSSERYFNSSEPPNECPTKSTPPFNEAQARAISSAQSRYSGRSSGIRGHATSQAAPSLVC